MDFVEKLLEADVHHLPMLRQEIAFALQQSTAENRTPSLIALMVIETSLGENAKARSLAENIWKNGESFTNPLHELVYVNGLLDLAMLEMAASLLKPRFEHFYENLGDFSNIFLKFAIMAGSANLMEKVAVQIENETIEDFIGILQVKQYEEHFKQIQKIALNEVKDTLCGYNFDFYEDRGFPDLVITFALASSVSVEEVISTQQAIDDKLEEYYKRQSINRLNNLSIKVARLEV